MTYPKTMNHPHYVPAQIERPTLGKPLRDGEEAQPPKAAMFPPVTVNTEDQEHSHRAQGYLEAGETLDEYVPQMYPKWCGNVIVNSEDEELALLMSADPPKRTKAA